MARTSVSTSTAKLTPHYTMGPKKTEKAQRSVTFGKYYTTAFSEAGRVAFPLMIKAAAQELVGVSWESNNPLWSKQDCMRNDERTVMRHLKTYFKSILGSHPLELDHELPANFEGNGEEYCSEDPLFKPSERWQVASDELNVQENVSNNSKVSGISITKSGPFGGRSRYNANFILPSYKGLYTRIFYNWKAKMDAEAAFEGAMEEQQTTDKSADGGHSKRCIPYSALHMHRKPKVQRIALRKGAFVQKPNHTQRKANRNDLRQKSARSLHSVPSSRRKHCQYTRTKTAIRTDLVKQNVSDYQLKSRKRRVGRSLNFGYHVSQSLSTTDYTGIPKPSSSSTDISTLQYMLRGVSSGKVSRRVNEDTEFLEKLRLMPSLLSEFNDKVLRVTIRFPNKHLGAARETSLTAEESIAKQNHGEKWRSVKQMNLDRIIFDFSLADINIHDDGIEMLINQLDSCPSLTNEKRPRINGISSVFTATFIDQNSAKGQCPEDGTLGDTECSNQVSRDSPTWKNGAASNSLLNLLENDNLANVRPPLKFLLTLIRRIPFPVFAKENSSDPVILARNRAVMQGFLQSIQNFFQNAVELRETAFGKLFRSLRHLHRSCEKKQHQYLEDLAETRRFRRRLLRVIKLLELRRWDAFTQPFNQNKAVNELRRKRNMCQKQIALAESSWEHHVEQLHKKLFDT
ncbi:uncharacterized protein LOC129586939 [Paramacrobiotus metropolitanus]|uniref:uncharacterized protein LOC129586939 n=1 Tax=Paramacrobiotus metropolitanus TaxID=2943436 RepID=UPI00244600E2|nr:uncharacterized protein LOC129586939 [Paramacrobiotus metropolitanus]